MPQTLNLKGIGVTQVGGVAARSCVYRPFASSTQTGVEVPTANAHYYLVTLFGGQNGNGANLGTASIDLGTQTIFEVFEAAGNSAEAVFEQLFPPPGPD